MKHYVICSLLLINAAHLEAWNWSDVGISWGQAKPESAAKTQKRKVVEDSAVPPREEVEHVIDVACATSDYLLQQFRPLRDEERNAIWEEKKALDGKAQLLDRACAQGKKEACAEFDAVKKALEEYLNALSNSALAEGEALRSRTAGCDELRVKKATVQKLYADREEFTQEARKKRNELYRLLDEARSKCPTEAGNCTDSFLEALTSLITENEKNLNEKEVTNKQELIAAWMIINRIAPELISARDLENIETKFPRKISVGKKTVSLESNVPAASDTCTSDSSAPASSATHCPVEPVEEQKKDLDMQQPQDGADVDAHFANDTNPKDETPSSGE